MNEEVEGLFCVKAFFTTESVGTADKTTLFCFSQEEANQALHHLWWKGRNGYIVGMKLGPNALERLRSFSKDQLVFISCLLAQAARSLQWLDHVYAEKEHMNKTKMIETWDWVEELLLSAPALSANGGAE